MHDEQNFRFASKDKVINLTVNQNRALELLIRNKNSIVTYEQLCHQLYREKPDKYLKLCIQNTICKLRTKLKGELEIITRNSIGYILL